MNLSANIGGLARAAAAGFAPVGDGAGTVNARQAQRSGFERKASERTKALGTAKLHKTAQLVAPKGRAK